MSPEHIDLLASEYDALRAARQAGERYDLSALGRAAGLLVTQHVMDKRSDRVPALLSMPFDVAEAYLLDPKSLVPCTTPRAL